MDNKTILLVEDNLSDIALTKRALHINRISNKLIVVEDGQEALDYLFCAGKYIERDGDELPTIILLDLKLPKVNGLEVLKRIRQNEKTKLLPVVILTTSKEEMDVATAYDLGANSYIRKPVDFHQFAEAVNHLRLYWLVINEPPPSI